MRDKSFTGVDGCRSGWIAVIGASPARSQMLIARQLDDLNPRTSLVAIDMPIGLPEREPRSCEAAARRLLPHGRKSSVFPVPRRALLDCSTYPHANQTSKDLFGCGLPKQSWNLFPKLREADAWALAHDQRNIFEAHPELAFLRLNKGQPLPPKRTREGLRTRRKILERAGFKSLGKWMDTLPSREAKADDLFDACALLTTAIRIGRKQAQCVTLVRERDAKGLRMEIWY
jgi:predicted RNase H-like nuclease